MTRTRTSTVIALIVIGATLSIHGIASLLTSYDPQAHWWEDIFVGCIYLVWVCWALTEARRIARGRRPYSVMGLLALLGLWVGGMTVVAIALESEYDMPAAFVAMHITLAISYIVAWIGTVLLLTGEKNDPLSQDQQTLNK